MSIKAQLANLSAVGAMEAMAQMERDVANTAMGQVMGNVNPNAAHEHPKDEHPKNAIEANRILGRVAHAANVTLAVERQKGRNDISLHGAYVLMQVKSLLDGLYSKDQPSIQPQYLADYLGTGFSHPNEGVSAGVAPSNALPARTAMLHGSAPDKETSDGHASDGAPSGPAVQPAVVVAVPDGTDIRVTA